MAADRLKGLSQFASRSFLAAASVIALTAAIQPHALAQSDALAAAPLSAPTQRINPTNRVLSMEVEVYDISQTIGSLRIAVTPNDEISMDVERLIAIIGPLIGSRRSDALMSAAASGGTITLEQINQAGVPMRFDFQRYGLRLEIGVDDREATTIDLIGRRAGDTLNFRGPDPFSIYLNYSFSLDFIHRSDFEETGIHSPQVDLELVTNLYGFVLENEFYYDQDNPQDFSREATRLVYDWQDQAIRFTLGDTRTAQRAFMSSEDILGITISRLYTAIQPGRNIRPRGTSAFTLERESQIEILVNGVTSRTLRLPAGSYNLSDFSFIQGTNDVQIIAQDSTGRRELANFSYFFDSQLLDPGIVEFSASYGIRSQLLSGERFYDEDDYYGSGFVRAGVLDNLTLGASFAFDDTGYLVGGEALLSTGFGLFGFDGLFSSLDGFDSGWIGRASYQGTFDVVNPADLLLLLSAEYQTEFYSGLGVIPVSSPLEMTYSGSFNYTIDEDLAIFAGGQFSTYRDGSEDTWGINAGFAWRVTDDIQFRAAGTAERDDNGDMEYGVGLRITARFGADQFASASYDSINERADISWSRSPGIATDSWEANASLSATPDAASFNGGVGYTSNRGVARLQHSSAYDAEGSRISDSRTSIQGEGSIAFVGGDVTVGRRISDSFAIVRAHESLGDTEVLIEPTPDGDYVAKSDDIGPALVSDLGSYTPRSMKYVVEDAPPGYDLGDANFSIRPTYRSGFALTVGSAYNVIVVGSAVDAKGAPIALEVGTAESLDDPNAPKVGLFTNRDGRFVASGLSAGQWKITLGEGGTAKSFVVEIPDGKPGVVQVGAKEAR